MSDIQKEKDANQLRRNEIFLLVLALVVLLLQLNVGAFWGSESRWGEVVREMFESGNFFRTAVNGKPYLEKPLFSYWIILPFAKLFGETEFVCRLPSAIAGWLLLIAQMLLGRHFFDRKTALFSSWLLFCSYGFIFWSRRASEVMPEAAFCAWIIVLFLSQERAPALWKDALFYLLIGVLIFNGRIPAVLMLAAMLIPYRIFSGSWRKIFRPFRKKLLLAGVTIIFIIFYGFVLSQAGMYDLFPQVKMCSFTSKESFFNNWIDFFRAVLPWGLWFVAAVAGMIINYRKLEWKVKALLWGCAGAFMLSFLIRAEEWGNPMIFATFSTIVSAGALMSGVGDKRINMVAGRIMYFVILIAGALALAFGVLIPVWNVFFSIDMPMGILVSVPLAGLAAQAIMLFDGKAAEALSLPDDFGAPVLAGAVILSVIFSFIYPALDNFRKSRDFLLQAKAAMQQEEVTKLICVGRSINAEELFYIAPGLPVKHVNDLAKVVGDGKVALIWEDDNEDQDNFEEKAASAGLVPSGKVLKEDFSELSKLNNKKDKLKSRNFVIVTMSSNKKEQ